MPVAAADIAATVPPGPAAAARRFLLSVVIPCFNEQEVVRLTYRGIVEALGHAPLFDLQIIFVDDGSRDATAAVVSQLVAEDGRVVLLMLSRNFGHQAALAAGMQHANGDAVVLLDADLQDPPAVILRMLASWQQGYQVVFGVRTRRKEGIFKRCSYAVFYRLYRALSDIEVPLDSGDFALLDRSVLDVMNRLPERNRFLRGLRSWTGFRQIGVPYERAPRAAGRPKYTLGKLVVLAADGILNFSTVPLTFIFLTGVGSALLASILGVFLLLYRIIGFKIFGHNPEDVPGFTSVILALLFFSGVQLMSIGILGAYLGRIYQEVKGRPTFVISQIISHDSS